MAGTGRVTVAVLGAGPAGLMAAWRAAERGHAVVVLEREPHVGGMAASTTVAGQRVDLGSHRLHPAADPGVLDALHRLLGGELQWRPRHGRIRLEGRWVRFPLRAPDLVRSLRPSFAAGLARDAVTKPLRRERADTFAEVVRARLGPTMLDRFYGPYARKLWGLPPDQLAGEHARRRIGARGPGALVAKAVSRRRAGFWYPAGGFGRIPEVLADAAVAAGADIRLGAEVAAVERGRITTTSGTVVEADHVWSTLPLAVLARLAGQPAVDLPLRALVLVYLVLDLDRWTEWDAHYLPGPETPVSRISEPKAYRDGADPGGRTVLCAEIPCDVGDDTWRAADDDLAPVVAETLEIPAPVEVATRRLPGAYPIHRAGVAVPRVEVPGVVSFGRGGLFAHDNTHHAMAEGWAAAGALAGDGTWDADSWSRACDRFAGHVVED